MSFSSDVTVSTAVVRKNERVDSDSLSSDDDDIDASRKVSHSGHSAMRNKLNDENALLSYSSDSTSSDDLRLASSHQQVNKCCMFY